MGWGIIIKNVELRRVSKDGISIALEEKEETILDYREKLMMLAVQSPVPIHDEEGCEIQWVDWVQGEVRGILEKYDNAIFERGLLYAAQAFPEDVEAW
jgi:hypothetical protein